MQYLGVLRGVGNLTSDRGIVARVAYDIDGYLMKPGQVTGCGEIRMPSETLKALFGRTDLNLMTDDGRALRIHFSEKRLLPASDAAHVDVAGELPLASEWRQ